MPRSIKKRSKESYFLDKLSMRAKKTQDGVKYSLKNFDKFCLERHNASDSEIVKKLVKYYQNNQDRIFDVLQDWVNWNHENDLSPGSIKRYFSGVTARKPRLTAPSCDKK